MKLESLKKLYLHELKDIYSAERQFEDALPRFMQAADREELTALLRDRRAHSSVRIDRIERIVDRTEFSPRGHKCKGMDGLLTEATELLEEDIDPEVRDAAIVASVQRASHYLMSAYGTARAFAEKLSQYEAADTLQKSLDEEGRLDRSLTTLAERSINFEAMEVA